MAVAYVQRCGVYIAYACAGGLAPIDCTNSARGIGIGHKLHKSVIADKYCQNPVKARVSAFMGFLQFDKIRIAVWTICTDYMTLSQNLQRRKYCLCRILAT